jgi:hypothetical protein
LSSNEYYINIFLFVKGFKIVYNLDKNILADFLFLHFGLVWRFSPESLDFV